MTRSQKLLSSLGFAAVVSALVAGPTCASNIAQVTGVRLNPTSEGIEIILDTEDGRPLQVFSASFGETLQADVITAQLRLPGGNEFRQDKPAAGIVSVPRSITVIDSEELQQQVGPLRNIGEALATQVPGFAPPTQTTTTYGQTLRGRDVSVLIEGVPQTTNLQSFGREFRTIDPSAIERIEVVRGSTAIYGAQATGGVINIITRRPTEERLSYVTEVGVNSALTNTEDALGFNAQQTISGRTGNFDLTGTVSIARSGAFYDAKGR